MDWEIQGLSNQCFQCQGSIAEGDEFFSLLVLDDKGIPKRNDSCGKCFVNLRETESFRAASHSFWRGTARFLPPPPRPKPLPYERFELLLRKYITSDVARDKRFAYILALLLERKKILIPRDSIPKEGTSVNYLVYDHAESGETFFLEDPQLSLNQADEVQTELKSLMDEELQLAFDAKK